MDNDNDLKKHIDLLADELRLLQTVMQANSRDEQTRGQLFVDMLEKYQRQLEECKTALEACSQQLRAIQHRIIDEETISGTYSQLSTMRQTRCEEIESRMEAVLAENKKLKITNKRLRENRKK